MPNKSQDKDPFERLRTKDPENTQKTPYPFMLTTKLIGDNQDPWIAITYNNRILAVIEAEDSNDPPAQVNIHYVEYTPEKELWMEILTIPFTDVNEEMGIGICILDKLNYPHPIGYVRKTQHNEVHAHRLLQALKTDPTAVVSTDVFDGEFVKLWHAAALVATAFYFLKHPDLLKEKETT